MEIVNLSHSKSISRRESLNESPGSSEINYSYIDDNDGSEATYILLLIKVPDENEERKEEIVTKQDEEISLDNIKNKEYESKTSLGSDINDWASGKNFKLRFTTREREFD